MTETILEIQDIHAGYGDTEILRGVSLIIPRSGISAIVGPNGAGKSTLMKAMFGLVKAKPGKILLRGEDITRYTPRQRLSSGLAYVPQARGGIFPLMSVKENLEIASYSKDRDTKKEIKTILERFPKLNEKRDQLAGNLSGGEQQLLAMSMGLLFHPDVLLLDEPSIGLSPIVVSSIFEEIKHINSQGTTIVMVEQNVAKALAISTHGIVLASGLKQFEGSGKEIVLNPELKRLYLGD